MQNLRTFSQKAKEYSYLSRIDIVKTVYRAKGGHLGGSLSVIDILSSIYAFQGFSSFELILSKGHCLLAWIATLIRTGELKHDVLNNFYNENSRFGGHPKKGSTNSITWSTGSLGHGLSITCGKAFANKNKNYICILGDGELNEGSIWEALMFLSQHNLNNILVMIDNNKQESLARTEEILSVENLELKIGGMRLDVKRIDGHNIDILVEEINDYFYSEFLREKPLVLICDTIKGKGVSFMEADPKWHHRKIKDHEYEIALRELEDEKN
tara:strand:+ start:897 stop:1703 length:807 start_codon:yes stop_codon:yes gene_type:complete